MATPSKEVDGAVAPETARTPKTGMETARAVLVAALVALAIRSFVIEPFKIPSGSMIPTLLVGDYVLVNKFAYGVRLPLTGTLLFDVGEPRRGDIMVFRYPDDPSQDFIKRVVGVPGDRIEMQGGRLWVNGQPLDRIPEGEFVYQDVLQLRDVHTRRYIERNPDGEEYTILRVPGSRDLRSGPWIVPEGKYFAMGDNRDHSADSRRWRHPYVSADQIKGRAFMIHWSWIVAYGPNDQRGFVADLFHTLWKVVTFQVEEVRWGRIGRSLDGLAAGTPGLSADERELLGVQPAAD